MADRPILFSAPMVLALLAGTKTQTRRIFKPQPTMHEAGDCTVNGHRGDVDYLMREIAPKHWGRFRPGDRLYVREHWHTNSSEDGKAPRDIDPSEYIWYVADGAGNMPISRFRQGMHMPRWASRLTLHVTEVRVQRLQEISEADAVAEGIQPWPSGDYGPPPSNDNVIVADNPTEAYMELWNSINGTDAWDANPWITATTFVVEKINIEHARAAA